MGGLISGFDHDQDWSSQRNQSHLLSARQPRLDLSDRFFVQVFESLFVVSYSLQGFLSLCAQILNLMIYAFQLCHQEVFVA